MDNKDKIQSLNIVMNGITINGPMFDIHDNGTVNNYFANSSEDKRMNASEERAMQYEEPLRNHIFQERIFDTNERLIALRNTIASAIDMGEATIMYGKPQEVRINPNAQNEWYYIVKAIEICYNTLYRANDGMVSYIIPKWFERRMGEIQTSFIQIHIGRKKPLETWKDEGCYPIKRHVGKTKTDSNGFC